MYCNEEALKKIQKADAAIKISCSAYSDEKGGRKWTPSVVSQQKITFLEDYNVASVKDSAKVVTKYKVGSFELKKFDAITGKPVQGATYYLYEDKDCTELLCKMVETNNNGIALGGKQILTQSKYYVKEVLPPEGYLLDETVYQIGIEYFTLYDSNGKVTQKGKTFDVKETPDKVGVIVYKQDSMSGKWVKGAGFAVFKDAACTVRVKTDGKEGKEVPIFYYDEDLEMAASEKFAKEQETYYVKEVVVPDGYKDDGKVYPVQPENGGFSETTIPNTPLRCDVQAVKEDKETGNQTQGDATLEGATYGLYAAEDIHYPDGSGIVTYKDGDDISSTAGTEFFSTGEEAKKDALLATVQTDKKGKFHFGNLYYGNYYIREIEESEGYLLDAMTYAVDFTKSGEKHKDISISQKVYEKVIKQSFEILKVSVDTEAEEDMDYVQGAEFTVKLQSEVEKYGWDEAKTYDVLITDEDGVAVSKELPYGTYLVKETKVPKDLYKTDDFVVEITEDSREPQAWRVLNDAPFKSYIRLVKKDAETGEVVRLAGATFKIVNAKTGEYVSQKVGDKKVTEFVTDETGTVTTPLKLKYGEYEVEEIKAPHGYLISEENFPFIVTKEGAVKVEENKDGELYKYLLIVQCNALNSILPRMFQKIADYTELLLPDYLLREGSVIEQLVHTIPKEDWTEQVQIIGWLYQYYNTEPKDKAFNKKGTEKIANFEIPAATQLFTPDWIVCFLVQNSLGKLWLDYHEDSPLVSEWKYYWEECKQTEKRNNVSGNITPEEIKCLDPCVGSGHILISLFDTLMQIYESYGYSVKDAVGLIIEKNLWGLDIDERASQLAYFSVMMKARQFDRGFFHRKIQPNIFVVSDGKEIDEMTINYFSNGNNCIEKDIRQIIKELDNAKCLGSLCDISDKNYDVLFERIDELENMDNHTIFSISCLDNLKPLINLSFALWQKYNVTVTNPPYLNISKVNDELANFVKKEYPDSKTDLFAVFIEKCNKFTKIDGYQAMITQHAWMYLSSFEKLRKKMLLKQLVTLAHLGAHAFEEIGGEVVQTAAFVFRNKGNDCNYKSNVIRLVEAQTELEKEEMYLQKENVYNPILNDFEKIEGAPLAYKATKKMIEVFDKSCSLSDVANPKQGLISGDVNRFVRKWFECSLESASWDNNTSKKWFPYNNGGECRRWYGKFETNK